MGVRSKWAAHSRRVQKSKRWPGLRQEVLRRDDWRCRSCGAAGALEVDHILPVRTAPERAFDLDNLQALCRPCHARKTNVEMGRAQPNPKRNAWARAVQEMRRKPVEQEELKCSIL